MNLINFTASHSKLNAIFRNDKNGTEIHTHINGFHHLFSGILFDNFLDKWEGKISEVSASIVPTLMHVLFNTISKLISVLRICNK